jgi:pilus assembly protein CpaB
MYLGLALVAAGAAALLLTRWVNARTAMARIPTAKVVVASVDLPIGTRVAKEHLDAVDWPLASRPSAAIAEPGPAVGQIVAARIFKGEPVLPEKLVSGNAGSGLAALLPEGARAVSVRVDDVVGVAGFIHPGDTVDVIVTMRPSEGTGSNFTSKIILQNIKVLAVGKEVDGQARGGDKVIPATVATLQVDSAEAEKLALAASKGQLLLALRSGADDETVATRGVVPSALLAGAEAAPAVTPPHAKPEPTHHARSKVRVAAKQPSAPNPEKQVVEIMRGDLFERRGFEKREGTP